MLHYTVKGAGKTILLLHGFLENAKMWEYFQNTLSINYQVICVDLPGHGRSAEDTKEVNRMEDMAEQVNEVLEYLNIEKVIIIGHSMGGYVALAFADLFRAKVDGLSLFYSTCLPDDEAKKEQRLKAAEIVVKNPNEFFRLSIPNLFNPEKIDNFRPEIEQAITWAKETSLTGISAALKGMRLRLDRTNIIKELNKPVLVIMGEYDTAVKNSELEKSIHHFSNISLHKLPTGHMGAMEAPDDCLLIIKNWLSDNFDQPINKINIY